MRVFQVRTGFTPKRNALPLTSRPGALEWQVVAIERDARPHHVVQSFRPRNHCRSIRGMKQRRIEARARNTRRASSKRCNCSPTEGASSTSEDAKWVDSPSSHKMRRGFQRRANLRQIFERKPEPPHARINFQMDGVPRHAQTRRCPLQQLDLAWLPNRRGKALANDLFFLATPEAGHQQDAAANACVAQRDGLIQRGHALPARAFLFQRAGTFDGAVAVGVGFHHGADIHAGADVPLHHAKIVPEIGERNFGPSGTRRHPLNDFNCSSHFRRL